MLQYKSKKNEGRIESAFENKDTGSPGERSMFQLRDNRLQSVMQKQLIKGIAAKTTVPEKSNGTGLPDNLKSGIENLSGYSMDDVKVHYNSGKPAQLNAHAYAQGTDIHIASGQEKHLAHEAWHVVQQKQGRVKPTMQMKGKVNVNDDVGLEKEADVMGAKSLQSGSVSGQKSSVQRMTKSDVVQKEGWGETFGRWGGAIIGGIKGGKAGYEERDTNNNSHDTIDRIHNNIEGMLEGAREGAATGGEKGGHRKKMKESARTGAVVGGVFGAGLGAIAGATVGSMAGLVAGGAGAVGGLVHGAYTGYKEGGIRRAVGRGAAEAIVGGTLGVAAGYTASAIGGAKLVGLAGAAVGAAAGTLVGAATGAHHGDKLDKARLKMQNATKPQRKQTEYKADTGPSSQPPSAFLFAPLPTHPHYSSFRMPAYPMQLPQYDPSSLHIQPLQHDNHQKAVGETRITYTAGHINLDKLDIPGNFEVGKKMVADLWADDPVKGSATGVNWTWMQDLRKKRPNANFVRGHLLNHDLGGFGVPQNLYPISTLANQKHSTDVEQEVKGLLKTESMKGDEEKHVHYEVEVLPNGSNPLDVKFHCIYGVDGEKPEVKDIDSSYKDTGGFGGGKKVNPLAGTDWHHGKRKGLDGNVKGSYEKYGHDKKITVNRDQVPYDVKEIKEATSHRGGGLVKENISNIYDTQVVPYLGEIDKKEVLKRLGKKGDFKKGVLNFMYTTDAYAELISEEHTNKDIVRLIMNIIKNT